MLRVSQNKIKKRIKELGKQISIDYPDGLHIIAILKGSVIFLADLVREITVPITYSFITASSYGVSMESSGKVQYTLGIDPVDKEKDILLLDDIADTGLTLNVITEVLSEYNLKICVLLNKLSRRQVNINIDYIGFEIPDEFVVGYGLDYGEKFRQLPYIQSLKI